MKLWRRLDVRLFASYALVALVVFARARGDGPRSSRRPASTTTSSRSPAARTTESESHNVFVDSLDSSAAGSRSPRASARRRSCRRSSPAGSCVRCARCATRPDASRTGTTTSGSTEPGELELAELARDVNRLAVELETTERRRARLISEVAHEMRTPLTTIEGYVEGMLDGVFEPSEEVLVAVGEETSRLQRLASDLGRALRAAEEGAIDAPPAGRRPRRARCARAPNGCGRSSTTRA